MAKLEGKGTFKITNLNEFKQKEEQLNNSDIINRYKTK